jgi:hypothetical protein
MSVSSAFLWRFLEDVWDLLPTEDRTLFESYWSAQIQIASDLEHKTLEAALSTQVSAVPVFLTERWNRFLINEDSCDLFTQSDAITLTLFTGSALSRETVLYDTLTLSVASGQIQHEETMTFFDRSVRSLRYGKIIKGAISVTLGGQEFTPGRDYAVNLETGTIQAIDTGRIPIDQSMTIRYQHKEYTRGTDYDIDETATQVFRLAGTTIASGASVVASYTYNGTATNPLDGTAGSVSGSTLTDTSKDFSSVIPGRTMTISGGPNAGSYTVNAVPNPTQIQVVQLFPSVQGSDVVYAINAFPHGIKVDKTIVSIPHLRDRIDDPTFVLIEGVDYSVRDGILSVKSAFPLSPIGPSADRERQAWAETTKVNKETPYRNFGVLIDFFRENSEAYKLALQGLWYTFWTGSTPGNFQRGMQILLGLPFAKRAGTVTRVDAGEIDITDTRGQIITYVIPTGLATVVSVGDLVDRFASLTTGVSIIDRNNEPGFVAARLGRAGIARYLTSNASTGLGDTDETKALALLEHHLFLPQILVEAIVQRINVRELVTFLDNMKPQWTEYVFSFLSEESESITLTEETPAFDLAVDLTSTVDNNQWNQSFLFNRFLVQAGTGGIMAGGTQATGNFRDLNIDFAALGVDMDDTVRITEGLFIGYHRVLKRISTHLLSLDIPDGMIVGAPNLDYVVIPSERLPDNDTVNLAREHILLTGANYLAPAVLNTKTDIDLAGSSLKNEEIKALLLVDFANAGSEVQPITAANKDLNEINVATPPAPAAQVHEISSCSLYRFDNGTVTVTDAFAI